MRIETSGQYEWRNEQYKRAADMVGEATKSKGIDASTAFTIEMVRNLERAIEHPDMTPELAEVLSTDAVQLRYQIDSGVDIPGADDGGG